MRWLAALICVVWGMGAEARAETHELRYQAVVLGVVVLGEVEYRVSETATAYNVAANLRTAGLARLFDQTVISSSARGARVGAGVSWSRYVLDHSYARKRRRTVMERGAGGITSEISPRHGDMGTPPASNAQQAQSYDPLSAVFALGRQIGAARTCRGSVLVFDGRQHYRLSVSPRARGTYNGGGYNGPAVSCNFRYTPISGFSEDFDPSNIPAATAWFAMPAEPGFAAPLQLSVPAPVGEAQLNLSGYMRRP